MAVAHHPAPWSLVQGQSLADLLAVTEHITNGGCSWRRGHCALSDHDRLDAAAWLLAREIMRLRCGRAREIFKTWQAAATGVPVPAGRDLTTIAPFIAPTFGLPPTGGSVDHIQGHVAEIAWRILANEEKTAQRTVLHLARPDSDVTSPGADGFIIYRTGSDDRLIFRLWEIKKRSGSGSVSSSIRRGYVQLDFHAERYLAKLTGQSEVDGSNPELASLFAELVPAWKRADPAAGAGVALVADAGGLPERAFTTMHNHFPRLVAAGGIEGCLLGIGSLREFSLYVRTLLWNGLSTVTT